MTDGNGAIERVRAFLAAVEARDFDTARTFLAADAVMTFPGSASFRSLDELSEWARPRYRRVAKRFERFDWGPAEDGDIVVAQGVLYGEWPDGTAFDGIRFIDWFHLRGGKIAAQRVWNDLAVARSAALGSAP